MSISIRPYRAEDAMAVREVHLRAFENRREEALLVELLHTASAAVEFPACLSLLN